MTLFDQIFKRTPPLGIQRGLEVMHRIAEKLDHPEEGLVQIHVAGSNAKGSVATKIATALQASGLKVGLYTSPHLISFCERITINAVPIDPCDAEKGIQHILDTQCEPTFFEIATALAWITFRSQGVDVAVIETGLGGTTDATNIITPILSVITSISKEHSERLGDRLEAIAREKAGIIKPGVPVVLGPYARQQTIYQRADELGCVVYQVHHTSDDYDEENRAIARRCLDLLSHRFALTGEHIEQGLAAHAQCRMEKHGKIIYDVAHNPDACLRLVRALCHRYPGAQLRFLLGFCQDKQIKECIRIFSQVAVHLHFVQAATPRSADVAQLAQAAGCSVSYSCHASIEEGMKEAHLLGRNQANELLVVTGSFYLMGQAKAAACALSS